MPEHTFDTPAPVDLDVEIRSGTVTITTHDEPTTQVVVEGPQADSVEIRHDGDRVRVAEPKPLGFFARIRDDHPLDVRISCPRRTAVAVRCGSADVRIEGEVGEAQVQNGAGDVWLPVVHGGARVKTGFGDVSIQAVGADLHARTGSGDVRADEVGGEVSVVTGSGDIALGEVAGSGSIRTGSGDITVRSGRHDLSLASATGDVVVGEFGAGKLSAKNASGDIRIGVPAGVPVWTDVSSTMGTVRSNLTGAGQPKEGEPWIELRATTATGDVVLEQR